MDEHFGFIKQTYALALKAKAGGDHPFGAMLVRKTHVFAKATNKVNSLRDPTRHAEFEVMRNVFSTSQNENLLGATLYSSTEPCAMCTGAAVWSGVSRIVYGCPSHELSKLTGGLFPIPCRELVAKAKRKIEIVGPVLAEEGIAIHEDYWNSKTKGELL